MSIIIVSCVCYHRCLCLPLSVGAVLAFSGSVDESVVASRRSELTDILAKTGAVQPDELQGGVMFLLVDRGVSCVHHSTVTGHCSPFEFERVPFAQ